MCAYPLERDDVDNTCAGQPDHQPELNWRPTYDLVVLPPQAKVPTDPGVSSDLLAGYGVLR
jgi:hypothetical protein